VAKRRYRFGREYYFRAIQQLVAERYFGSTDFLEVDIDDL
jgi:hypothetical protein